MDHIVNVTCDLFASRITEALGLLATRSNNTDKPTAKSRVSDELLARYAAKKRTHMGKQFLTHKIPVSKQTPIYYIALQLEFGCRKATLDIMTSSSSNYTSVYSSISYRIADLLRDPKCELILAILEGRIQARQVALIKQEIICPSILLAERREMELRRQQKLELKTSSVHVCKKCNKRETLVREIQTRSSDEAPTLAIQCASCGHCWTQNS